MPIQSSVEADCACISCDVQRKTQPRTVEIGGKSFTPAEAREIDDQIDQLDALMKARRERVLASMAAEPCNCSACESARAYIKGVM